MNSNEKPVYIIINPKSGYGGRKLLLAELRTRLKRVGLAAVEHITTCAGDATDYAREITPLASAVLAWGGDGTANEVANGLAGSDVPLLIAPAGTENLLAKELRIPRAPGDLVALLKYGDVMECDMGMINGQTFHSILGVGFDAEVVRRLSASRTGHISHLSYFWPIWRTFWEHNYPKMRVFADGEEIFQGRGLAFVGNISRYSVGLRICRDAKFDDGLLDLVVFECQKQVGLILHAAWTMLRRHPLKGNVIYRPARNIRIETDEPLTCQMDGDVGPKSPLDISIAPFKMKLIVPHEASACSAGIWNFVPPWKEAPL